MLFRVSYLQTKNDINDQVSPQRVTRKGNKTAGEVKGMG